MSKTKACPILTMGTSIVGAIFALPAVHSLREYTDQVEAKKQLDKLAEQFSTSTECLKKECELWSEASSWKDGASSKTHGCAFRLMAEVTQC